MGEHSLPEVGIIQEVGASIPGSHTGHKAVSELLAAGLRAADLGIGPSGLIPRGLSAALPTAPSGFSRMDKVGIAEVGPIFRDRSRVFISHVISEGAHFLIGFPTDGALQNRKLSHRRVSFLSEIAGF